MSIADKWFWLIAGAGIAGPLCVIVTVLATRRAWRSARRLSARAHGQEQLVEIGQLAGGLAHEIKNPLSTINVNLKLLEEDLARSDDDPPAPALPRLPAGAGGRQGLERAGTHHRWLRRIRNVQEETNRVAGILDDFLRYAGKYELSLEAVDLAGLIDELADFFRPQAEAAHIVMRTSLPPGEVVCRADAKFVKQALLNLMINAADAMKDGGEMLIRLSVEGGRAIVEVIDTGAGIPPENLDKIFQVYYSTKQRGTGLGLPMTRRIVRQHGGAIRVESEVGKGTRFIVALPLAT